MKPSASLESQSQETRSPGNTALLLRDYPRQVVLRIISRIADLAIFIDVAIGITARKLFSLLPTSLREILTSINNEYITYRNKLLKIDLERNGSHLNSQIQYDSKIDPQGNDEFAIKQKGESAIRKDDELALQRGDVPGWVLVVLMTTGLVTALWTIAAPRLSQILRNSLDSMNGIR